LAFLEALGFLGQAVGSVLDLMVLIGGAEKQPILYKASKNTLPLKIFPEDANRSVCRNG
jgi:hypothetical protein